MTETKRIGKQKKLEAGVEDLKLENGDTSRERSRFRSHQFKEEAASGDAASPTDTSMNLSSHSAIKPEKASAPDMPGEKHEEVVGGDVTVKLELGQPPKLARSTSRKIVAGPAQIFSDYPSKTEEAKGHFQVIKECSYSSKYIGSTEHDSMDCDCTEEWGKTSLLNYLQL